jgi:hypothetical protein
LAASQKLIDTLKHRMEADADSLKRVHQLTDENMDMI